jgi:hypothetical protein
LKERLRSDKCRYIAVKDFDWEQMRLVKFLKVCGGELESFVYHLGVAPAAFEPMHFGFAPEPSELPLGIVSMALLSLTHSLRAS